MDGGARHGRGCFKYGCMGCAVVVGVPLLVVVLFAGARLIGESRTPQPETLRSEQELPLVPGVPEAAGEPTPTPAMGGEQPPVEMAPQLDDANPDDNSPVFGQPGRIVLDVGMAEFRLLPGAAGTPIRVEADYDKAAFDLTESFVEDDRGGWTYRLSFGSRGGWLGALMWGGNHPAEVRLTVPVDYPLAIEGRVGPGESRLELGGLWLIDVDLATRAGSHRVRFSEPLPAPLDTLSIDSSYGETTIENIGNASPATARFDHSAGELVVDLEGAWKRDATIAVDFSFGECKVLVPSTALVEIDKLSMRFGERVLRGLPDAEDLPPDAPTLTLSVSGTGGELSVR